MGLAKRATARLAVGGMAFAAVSVVGLVQSVPAATGTVPSFTWTGTDAANGNFDWSDPGNWQGNVAPAPNSTVDLNFTPVACDYTDTSCINSITSNDDVSGLTVQNMTFSGDTGCITNGSQTSTPEVTLGGTEPLVLNGITATSSSDPGGCSPQVNLGGNNPFSSGSWNIALGANQTWSVTNMDIAMFGPSITGIGALNIAFSRGALSVYSGSINVGPISITGSASNDGGAVVLTTTYDSTEGLNGADGEPVSLMNASLNGAGYVGPLSVLQNGIVATGGQLQVEGNATFDNSSVFVWGQSPTELTATGSVDLGNAAIGIVERSPLCSAPAGTVYTILDAAGGIGTSQFNLPTGAFFEYPACADPVWLRINYTPDTVTFTVVQSPLMIETKSLPKAVIGKSYSASLVATGGTPPYSWSIESGHLPLGLTLSATGVISGTPLVSQNAAFTVQVTDAGDPAQVAQAALTLTVGTGTALDPAVIPVVTDVIGGLTTVICPSVPSLPILCAYVSGT